MPRHPHPYLDWDGPLAFAHRGGASDRPENTLPSFQRAVDLGYTYLETDAHLSRDGVLFAFHDNVLDRTTDRRGALCDLTAAEIEAADAGWAFDPDGNGGHPCRGTGVTVPRLAAILEEWPRVRVNIDAKSDPVVEPLIGLIASMRAFDRVCIGSFSDARIARARRLAGSRLCTSMGPRAVALARVTSWISGRLHAGAAQALQLPVRGGGVTLVEPRLVRAAHRAGAQVHVWTVDDAGEMERLLDMGVDGLMTDRPAVLREVLERRALWH